MKKILVRLSLLVMVAFILSVLYVFDAVKVELAQNQKKIEFLCQVVIDRENEIDGLRRCIGLGSKPSPDETWSSPDDTACDTLQGTYAYLLD